MRHERIGKETFVRIHIMLEIHIYNSPNPSLPQVPTHTPKPTPKTHHFFNGSLAGTFVLICTLRS